MPFPHQPQYSCRQVSGLLIFLCRWMPKNAARRASRHRKQDKNLTDYCRCRNTRYPIRSRAPRSGEGVADSISAWACRRPPLFCRSILSCACAASRKVLEHARHVHLLLELNAFRYNYPRRRQTRVRTTVLFRDQSRQNVNTHAYPPVLLLKRDRGQTLSRSRQQKRKILPFRWPFADAAASKQFCCSSQQIKIHLSTAS